MKTKLKIHLRDLEAEALERLVHVYGTTKKRLVNALIAKEYNDFMTVGATTTPPNYELIDIVPPEGFPLDYQSTFTQNTDDLSAKNIWRIMRVYDYAMMATNDKAVKHELAEDWNEWNGILADKTEGDPHSIFYDEDLER